jgi:ribosome-binding factor A
VLRELAQLLREEVRDPRVGFVTLTGVEVSRDISHAKVYYSLLDPAADLEATAKALRSAAGFLRSQLGGRITARTVPQLEFVYDATSEQASRMDEIFRSLHAAAGPAGDDNES